jgi:hypothetical protein
MWHRLNVGWDYKAWVWGYAWGPRFWFTGPGAVSKVWRCAGVPNGIVTEFIEVVQKG